MAVSLLAAETYFRGEETVMYNASKAYYGLTARVLKRRLRCAVKIQRTFRSKFNICIHSMLHCLVQDEGMLRWISNQNSTKTSCLTTLLFGQYLKSNILLLCNIMVLGTANFAAQHKNIDLKNTVMSQTLYYFPCSIKEPINYTEINAKGGRNKDGEQKYASAAKGGFKFYCSRVDQHQGFTKKLEYLKGQVEVKYKYFPNQENIAFGCSMIVVNKKTLMESIAKWGRHMSILSDEGEFSNARAHFKCIRLSLCLKNYHESPLRCS